MTMVRPCDIPPVSVLGDSLRTAYFYDCYKVELAPDARSPMALYLDVVARTPRWIEFLMGVRNRVVARLGLKDLGALAEVSDRKPSHAYAVGDQAGIFKVLDMHAQEVILGESDKHLDVKLSVLKLDHPGGTAVYVSTVVHVHNALGRLYMFFVAPAHRIIAPATMARLSAPGPAAT